MVKKKVTIAELYRACVGKGGMLPEYFMHACTVREATLFLEGLHERQYSAWERARYIGYYSAAPHCKDFRFENMGQFPWEKEREEPIDEAQMLAEIQALRERALARDAEVLKKIKTT